MISSPVTSALEARHNAASIRVHGGLQRTWSFIHQTLYSPSQNCVLMLASLPGSGDLRSQVLPDTASSTIGGMNTMGWEILPENDVSSSKENNCWKTGEKSCSLWALLPPQHERLRDECEECSPLCVQVSSPMWVTWAFRKGTEGIVWITFVWEVQESDIAAKTRDLALRLQS